MAGKTLVDAEGSEGIQAGTPFVLRGMTFVSSVGPPEIATGRIYLLADAFESFIAPGVLAGNHSFVVGELAEDHIGGDRSVLVGYNNRQNNGGVGQAIDQVIIGNTIRLPLAATASDRFIGIGNGFTFTGFTGVANGFGGNVAIGSSITLTCFNVPTGECLNNVVIGPFTAATGSASVVIGRGALTVDAQAVIIGEAAAGGLQSVHLGSNATGPTRTINVGYNTLSGTDGISIGWAARGQGDSSIALGRAADTNNQTASMAFGRSVQNVLPNFCQIGGPDPYHIGEIRFGRMSSDTTGGFTYRLSTTVTTGNNATGNSFQLLAGLGTGSWTNSQNLGLELQVGLAIGGGTTLQTITTVIGIRHSDLNVSVWGGLGAAFGGGKKVMYLANATTAPTGAIAGGGIAYVTGGELHFLSSAGVDYAITPTGGGGATISSQAFTLTAAQFADLDVTPIATGIAAPGAGKYIAPVALSMSIGAPADASGGWRSRNIFFGRTTGGFWESARIVNSATGVPTIVPWGFNNCEQSADYVNAAPQFFATQSLRWGGVQTAVLNTGGAAYAIGDTVTIDGGGNDCLLTINTVDGLGAVLTFTITAKGTGYDLSLGTSTTTVTGVGVGFTVDVTAVYLGGAVTGKIYYTIENA